MHINQDVIKGKWIEFKGEVRKAMGKITNDELEQTKGDLTAIRGLIMQKYGKEKDDQFSKLSEKYGSSRDQATHKIKDELKS